MADEQKFMEIIADALDVAVDELDFETDFRKDIEYFDSLKGFLMITLVEDEFNVKIPVEEFLKFKSVGDMYKYTMKYNEEQKAQ